MLRVGVVVGRHGRVAVVRVAVGRPPVGRVDAVGRHHGHVVQAVAVGHACAPVHKNKTVALSVERKGISESRAAAEWRETTN